jgi:hypothetical protein
MHNAEAIIGTNRPGRVADRVIPWTTDMARRHGACDLAWWARSVKAARADGILPPAFLGLKSARSPE